MCRFLQMGLFALVFLGIPQVSADEQPKPAVLYHPIEVGTDWIEETDLKLDNTVKMTVLQAEKNKQGIVVETALVLGNVRKTIPVQRVLVSDKGLFLLSSGKTKYDMPVCLLKLPSKPGDTWETVSKSAQETRILTCVRREDEELDLPFNKVKTIRIDTTTTIDGKTYRYSTWYHEQCGRVKFQDDKRTVIMQSLTPPAKK